MNYGRSIFAGARTDWGPEQIREYLLYLVKDRNAAPNTVQIHRAALRFLYVKTPDRQWFDEQVARTRRRPGLPTVLSAEEITRILDRTANLKPTPPVCGTAKKVAKFRCYLSDGIHAVYIRIRPASKVPPTVCTGFYGDCYGNNIVD